MRGEEGGDGKGEECVVGRYRVGFKGLESWRKGNYWGKVFSLLEGGKEIAREGGSERRLGR